METFATKTGPDCIALQPEQTLETWLAVRGFLEYPNSLLGLLRKPALGTANNCICVYIYIYLYFLHNM